MAFSKNKQIAVYALIALATILSYSFAKVVLTRELAWVTATFSNINLNFVLFLFIYGLLVDKYQKKKQWSSKKGWLVWAFGMVALILFFRFAGGYITILG